VEVSELLLGPVVGIFETGLAGAPERGLGLDLLAAHRIDRLVGELDDMESIEANHGLRQVFSHPGEVGPDMSMHTCPMACGSPPCALRPAAKAATVLWSRPSQAGPSVCP
jgi:hypothetical protein